MPRKNRNEQELGWLLSSWEELARAELVHGGYVEITIKPKALRGRFYVRWEFTRPPLDADYIGYRASQQVSYPAPEATQFLPWFWHMSMRFLEYLDADDKGYAPPAR